MHRENEPGLPFGPGDLFDMERACADGALPLNAAESAPNRTQAAGNKQLGEPPGHRSGKARMAYACAGLAAVCLIWMALHGGSKSSPAERTGDISTGDAHVAKGAAIARTSSPPAQPAATPPLPADTPQYGSASAAVTAPVDARAVYAQAFEDLNARLSIVEARQAAAGTAVPMPARRAAAAQGAPDKPRRKPGGPAAATRPAAGDSVPPLAGYKLNTIYRGQAWIEHGGQAHALQVGDDLAGAKVLAIEAGRRRVVTSAGAIQ